jgi:uncharacterized membrane-anchored protein YitT (DUF2179 family)
LSIKWVLKEDSIVSPKFDLMAVGGASVILLLALVFIILWQQSLGLSTAGAVNFSDIILLQVLLNWPHFIISYRLLYRRKAHFKLYPAATVYIPSVLGFACFLAWYFRESTSFTAVNSQLGYYFWLVAALYLAWHYTGQAWGMMMTYARMSSVQFEKRQLLILRNCLRVLVLWHVIWGLQGLPVNDYIKILQAPASQSLVNILALAAFAIGSKVLWQAAVKNGFMEIRIIVVWLSIFVWYLALYIEPGLYVVIQLAHSAQYLTIALRYDYNQNQQLEGHSAGSNKPLLTSVLVYLTSIALGWGVFWGLNSLIEAPTASLTIVGLIGLAVNVHHYYTDSAIWKLGKQDVRKTLFSHLH